MSSAVRIGSKVSLVAGPARTCTLATIRLPGGTEMCLFWAGGPVFPTGRGGFSFVLLAVGKAVPEELASSLRPLQSLHIPQLLVPRAVEMFVFSVPSSQDLPRIFEFVHLLP